MLIVISPAKTLSFDKQELTTDYTIPKFLDSSEKLIVELQKYSPYDLSKLMSISANLSQLNYERNLKWNLPFNTENAKQSLIAFRGEVFTGIDVDSFSSENFEFAQNHLRILSGLYGVLRPLDLIQAYRLEMGTKLTNEKGKNLYDFWGNLITDEINKVIENQGDNLLVNLASNEYFKSVKKKNLKAEIITPIFKDEKNGKYKTISFYAKKARGLMTRYIIDNQLSEKEELRFFNKAGYMYNELMSSEKEYVFIR